MLQGVILLLLYYIDLVYLIETSTLLWETSRVKGLANLNVVMQIRCNLQLYYTITAFSGIEMQLSKGPKSD